MAAVLLDTTVVVDVLRGRSGALGRVQRVRTVGDQPYVCAITVEEAVRGLRPEEREEAEQLFSGLRTARLGQREGWIAGSWRREFARRGQTLAQADCLIGAAALSLGGRLATGNPRHFPMAELDVQEWPVGE